MSSQIASRKESRRSVVRFIRRPLALCFAAVLAVLPTSQSAALAIDWIRGIDGDWNDAASWDPVLPGPLDDVTIDRGTTDIVVTHDAGVSTINSLLLAESLSIVSGSTLTTSVLTGQAGATIEADGTGSVFRATGPTALDETNLRVTNGASLQLMQASSYAAGVRQRTLRSEGSGSRLDLSGVLSLRGTTTANSELLVDALSGGVIELGSVTEVLDGSIRFVASGADSLIDLQNVRSFTDTGGSRDVSRLEARAGGTLLLDTSAPLSITGYDILRDGSSSTLDTSALETLLDSRVTVVGMGTSLDLSSLTSADDNSFTAVDGASLTLATASYGADSAQILRAEGASTLLDLSSVETLSGATITRNVVDAIAEDGGRIDLSGATSLADSSLRLRALGPDSLVDASNLATFVDTGGSRDRSQLIARDGGTLLLDPNAPLSITGYDIVRNEATSTLDLAQLTTLVDSSVTAIGAGTSFDLSAVSSFDGNSFVAEDGASLSLATTAYDALDSARDLRARGAGASIDGSGWQSLTAPTPSSVVLDVEALEGGTVDLSGLTSASDGSVRFVASGADSLLDLFGLDTFIDSGGTRDRSALEARGGASLLIGAAGGPVEITGYDIVREGVTSVLDLSNLTTLVDSSVTAIGVGAGFDLSGLSSYDGNSFAAEDGATLVVDTPRYGNESGRRSLSAEGAQALLDGSAIETLAGGTGAGSSLTVRAAAGGTVDLSRVTAVEDSTVQFIADGANSLVLLEGVTRFADSISSGNDFSSLEARNGGEVRLGPGVSEVRGFELFVEDAGSLLELGGVSELTDSDVTLQGVGASLDLSSIASYDGNSFETRSGASFQLDTTSYAAGDQTRDFRAVGTGGGAASTIDGSRLTSLRGGGVNSALRVTAQSGGLVDLGGVVDLADSAVRFVAEGNGSVVDISGLDRFVDTLSSGNNFSSIEARSGGRVILGSALPISIDGYSIELIGATSSIDTGALQNLANSSVTTSGVGATLDLSGLSSLDGNSFEALGGSTLVLGAASYTTGDVTQRLQARGSGSRIDASGIQEITGGSGTALLRVDASAGGTVDFSGAGSLGGGNYVFLADGASSLLDLSGIARFEGAAGPIRSSLSALGGGAIEFGATGSASIDDYDLEVAGNGSRLDLTGVSSLTNSNLTVNGVGATADLSSLSTLDGNSFFAENGATLALTTTSYEGAGARWQAFGTNGATASLLDASSLTRLDGGRASGETLRVLALSGGEVDLAGVTQIVGGLSFDVDGAGSRVNLSSLAAWNDDVLGQFSSQMIVRDGASLDLAAGTVDFDGVNLTVRDALVSGGGLAMSGDVVLNAEGELDLDIYLDDARFAVGGNGAGTTRVNGDYEQTIATIMQISVGGAAVGEFDLLEVTGAATLAGEIEARLIAPGSGIPVYDPQIGMAFDVVTATQLSDAGFSITSFGFGDSRSFQAEIVSGGLGEILRLTVVIPEPSTALLLGLGLASLARIRRR